MTMRLHNKRIILLDPDILLETHLPKEINARGNHIKEIEDCLRPIANGRKPVNCWLHGRPGVGKTATGRSVLNKLEKEAGIRSVYVNCWENPSFSPCHNILPKSFVYFDCPFDFAQGFD